MDVQVYLYDSFTDQIFGGNTAGVVLDARRLDSETMQKIASELNAPTTGFVVGCEKESQPTYSVRYFTPRQEIDLCGHVTIALFTALVARGDCPINKNKETRLGLKTSAGILSVFLHSGENGNLRVEMEQNPPYFETLPELEPEMAREALGGVLLHPFLPAEIVSTGLRHLIVPFSRYEDLSRLTPDFDAIRRLSQSLKVDTVCVFSQSARAPSHVRMRDFCSGIGANEEPASGTTSEALTCYLFRHGLVPVDKFGEVRVHVEQGVEISRPSQIEARLTVQGGDVRRVAVQGQAVLALEGIIRIPEEKTA